VFLWRDAGVNRDNAGERLNRGRRDAGVHGYRNLFERPHSEITSSVTWASSSTNGSDDRVDRRGHRGGGGLDKHHGQSGSITSNTAVLTVTAPTLVSIAVTPASASIAAAGRRRSRLQNLFERPHSEHHSSVTWRRRAHSGNDRVDRRATGVARLDKHHGQERIDYLEHGVLTVTAPTLVRLQ